MFIVAIVGNPVIYGVKKVVMVESNSFETAYAVVLESGKILPETVLNHFTTEEDAVRFIKQKGFNPETVEKVTDKVPEILVATTAVNHNSKKLTPKKELESNTVEETP